MPASHKDPLAHLLSRTRATPAGCLEWVGYVQGNGYGRATVSYQNDYVHRHVYRMAVGPIPDGCEVRHRCKSRPCINAEHLFTLTEPE